MTAQGFDEFALPPHRRGRDQKREYNPLDPREESFFYDEKTSPLYLSFIALCAGYRPPRFFEPFCYVEIAHQKNLSVLLHAMAFPQGQFYLIDHNPIHVSQLRELLGDLGLENVEIIESTLEDLSLENLPPADYFVCCHELTRLCSFEENSLIDKLPHLLKPGGFAYFSYDCMPYWSMYKGAIHLMRLAFERSEGTLAQRATMAIAFLEQATQQNFALLSNKQGKGFVDRLKAMSVHEVASRFLLPVVWDAKYASQVESMMANAKMTYLTSADLQRHIMDQGLSKDVQEVLRKSQDVTTRELWIDVLLNQSERSDVFGKGSIRATATDLEIFFAHMQLWPLRQREAFADEVHLSLGKLAVKSTTYHDLYHELEKGNARLIDLSKQFAGRPHEFLAHLRIALLLGNITIGLERKAGDQNLKRCDLYHRMLLSWGPEQPIYLMSPFLGRGLRSSWLELQCLREGDERDPKIMAEKVFKSVRFYGSQFKLQGEEIKSSSAFYKKMHKIFNQYIDQDQHKMTNLGISIGDAMERNETGRA